MEEVQCSSSSYISHLLLLLLFLLLLPPFSLQQSQPLGSLYLQCLRNTTTTSSLSSTFTRNLNAALRNFTTLSSQGSKYAISTAGSVGQEMVYAVFQCRGDLSAQSCGECVRNITARLPQECPKAVGARVRLDGCFLRYDNRSFFSLDTTYVLGWCNSINTSDLVTLSTIANLMEDVTTRAPRQGGWAAASAIGLYAVAQCLGYLSEVECSQCLSSTSYRICNSRLGARVHMASCDFRYEAFNFLETPPAAALDPPSSAPSLSPGAGSGADPSPPATPVSTPPKPSALAFPPPLVDHHTSSLGTLLLKHIENDIKIVKSNCLDFFIV
ncbi:hypothetical protein L7F22_016334 [Adiantum nelumboides]|nr:hypothetical protein [Adiantum nelumboides]